ncbi:MULTISPECIES: ABC transporter ATP-binding protein [Streptococcus anginosus group]|jgi:ABC transporter related|uniref:ABC transporter ATP-binding protein n=1 Tax=Streptococcus anginosus group TaxID=671232 RepID=UPI001967F527|nr:MULTISPECIES: ABC transporter ATP-binding protein [Streptococcus anginosus group]MCY7227573.1 ABC transporter ATP-binding protein [Streptococcus anginosus]HEO3639307.1 ABC transporter ATP-binding protein [Streptococcus agalactiae]HEO4582325.1 ABC transporter ATP-binding protein [Streptococcus agalactiae]
MMKNDIINVKNINKSFSNYSLFEGFSLSIKENSIHAIIGPNGSGKTSLLRILTGLYHVDSGDVEARSDHAMLLENDYLYEEKSGIENLKIFGLYFGYKTENYEKYAKILNLKEHLEKRVSTYSKGMKRKLSLLIVILMDRGIIYLDEVTSGVDPISRVEIRKIINQLKLNGKTIVITSHDLSEVEKIADYISMIENGKLILNLTREEIKDKSLEDIFIEAGAKNEEFK